MRVEEKDAMSVGHVLFNKLCHEGGFSSPHSAKDVQAGAALHVAYGDDLVCLHLSAKDDLGHSDPPPASVLCSVGVSLQSFREIAMVSLRSPGRQGHESEKSRTGAV